MFHDFKSHIIAAVSSSPAFLALIDKPSNITIVASIVLPCAFFVISKTVDVLLQLYFKRKK